MEAVVNEIKQLREKREIQKAQFKCKIKYETVMEELRYNASRGRTKPSNLINRKKYGSFLYNNFLKYIGF